MKSKIEILVQSFILMFSIISIGWASLYHTQHGWDCDYYMYYKAGEGIYTYKWLYKNILSYCFSFLTIFNLTTGYYVWSSLQTVSFMVLTHYLLKVKYGIIFIILAIPAYKNLLQGGNMDIILAAVYLFEFPALFGILFKPHHFVFSFGYAVRRYITKNRSI